MMSSATESHGRSAAAGFLDALARHGVRWLFCNSGSDFPPIVEDLAGASSERRRNLPTPILVPHENVAISMAYGAALATGTPQVAMVHVGLGTANAVCGLFNAARHQVPLLLVAGRTPVLEGGRLGARNNYINWAQEMFDQAGMVRELVKWDYELRDPAQIDDVVDRAFVAATSSPPGPAYLVLPREVLTTPIRCSSSRTKAVAPAHGGRPRSDEVSQLAEWFSGAQRPLVVTSALGRTEEAFSKLSDFAGKWAVPVVQYRPRFMSLPTAHPMHAGYDPARWLKDADFVLVIDSDVPWIPDEVSLSDGCRVAHIGADPLYLDYPMRSFASDLSLAADPVLVLEDLDAILEKRGGGEKRQIDERRVEVGQRTRTRSDDLGPGTRLTNRYVSRCIADVMDDSTVLINEYTFTLEEAKIERSGRFYSHSPAGGLGWATGASLGVKLARPDMTVIATVGDGTYMFGNPTAAHFVSRAHGLPVLTVIYNNRRWAAVHRATLSMYPDGAAAKSNSPPLAVLEPSPDYERVVEASGGLGIRVEHADELPSALRRAVDAVRAGRQAVVNVLTEASYVRSS